MVLQDTPSRQAKRQAKKAEIIQSLGLGLKSPRCQLIQLMGREGSGSRRLALSMGLPARHVIWMSAKWRLYSPLLWKIAEDLGISLTGMECTDKKRLRSLWKETLEAGIFETWILEGFELTESEGFFLQRLLRNFSIRVLILDTQPHSFCTQRAHISLSHHHYRIVWTKGKAATPHFIPAPFFERFSV